MKFLQTEVPGVLIVEPDVWRDQRGFFLETFHAAKYREGGIAFDFVQDNHSRSVKNTLRGLHAQKARPQGKLVRCVRGEIWDVAADPRSGKWVGVALSEDNFRQLWVPPGLFHGFCVLSDVAEVEYKCTALYDKSDEIGVVWNDPAFGIRWPVAEPVLSPKDAALPQLKDVHGR